MPYEKETRALSLALLFCFWGAVHKVLLLALALGTWIGTWDQPRPQLVFILPGSSLEMLCFSLLHLVWSDSEPFQGFMSTSGTLR